MIMKCVLSQNISAVTCLVSMTFYTRNDVTFRVHRILQVIYCQFYYFDSAFSSPLSRFHPIKTKENEIQRCNWTVRTQNGIE